MNPEFLRNVWLELTPGRLIGMGAVLGAIWAIKMLNWPASAEDLSWWGWTLFFLIGGLWGTRRAAACLPEEIAAGTWDAQRMSALGAWSFTWGKVLGGTVYVWAGASICLAMALLGMSQIMSFADSMITFITQVAAVLTGQLLAFTASLAAVRKTRDKRQASVTLAQILGLIALLSLSAPLGIAELQQQFSQVGDIQWYGAPVEMKTFSLYAALAFLGWGWLGAYRMIRGELQYRNRPWAWPLFVIFCMTYFAGFAQSDPIRIWTLAFSVGVVLTYVAILAESRNVVRYRRLLDRIRRKNFGDALTLLPTWVPCLPLVIIAGAIVVGKVNASPMTGASGLMELPGGVSFSPGLWVTAMILFLLRDLFLAHLLGFMGRGGQKDMAWLVSLIFLYAILPALAGALGLTWALKLFWPMVNTTDSSMVILPLMEAVALGGYLWSKMKSLDRQVGYVGQDPQK